MRVRLAGIVTIASTAVLLQCSLLVDTDGLSGGPVDGGFDALGLETGADGPSDAPITNEAFGPIWLAYGEVSGAVHVRSWNAETAQWSAEQPGPNVGATVRWVVPKQTPDGSFLAVVSEGASSKLDVFQRAADGSWTLGFSQPMPIVERRAFDIDYETSSHAVIVAYGDATPQVKVRRLSGGAWSPETALKESGTLPPQWVELARHPLSNEASVVYADDGSNLFTARWDGQAWADTSYIEGHLNSLDWKCFDAAYENISGNLLITWGWKQPYDGGEDTSLRYVVRTSGGALSAPKSVSEGRIPGPMTLVPEPGTKRILLSYVEYACNAYDEDCDDFGVMLWDGASIVPHVIDEDSTTRYGQRPSTAITGAAWLGATGHAIAAYHRDLADPGQLAYASFDGSDWTAPRGAAAPPALGPRASMQLVSVPGDRGVAVVQDTAGKLWSKAYLETDGTGTWSDVAGGVPLASSLLTPGAVPFGVAVP